MGQFSEDGEWWWNGAAWVATSKVVIPDLGLPTGSEEVVRTADRYRALVSANEVGSSFGMTPAPESFELISTGLLVTDVLLFRRTFRALRQLKLAQLEQATRYLLGPNEPVLAAEPSLYTWLPIGFLRGAFAVVVTKAHVLVLESARPLEFPRWVALAASPSLVEITVDSHRWLGLLPALGVVGRGRIWRIEGVPKVFEPDPVLAAWSKAVASATITPSQ